MSDTDEISLVDLFAVVLRYRKLVVGLPLILTALVGVYLFALPLLGIKTVKKDYLIQYSATINPLPENLKDRISIDVAQSLNAYFSSVPVQIQVYGKYFPKDVAPLQDGELTTFIKKAVIEKKLKFVLDPKGQVYTLSFTTQDKENGGLYLADLWSGAENGVMERLRSSYAASLLLLEQGIAVYDSAKKLDAESLTGKAVLVNAKQSILALQINPSFPFEKDPEKIVLIANSGGRSKTVLLVFFASLFIAVLGAFILQSINTIKKDPEAMEKIRVAIAEGKKKS
jgi:hypothetical protein